MQDSILILPPPMNPSKVLSRWPELPSELLDVIARKLISYVDYVRLRAVCPSWRLNLPKKPSFTQLPLLLLPHYENNIVSETHCSLFNLSDEKTYRLELPEVIAKGKQCWGSPHGWLVVLDEEGPFLSLLNPLTRDQIQLPSLFFFPSTLQNDQVSNIVLPWDSIGYLRNSYVVKAALFAKPSVSTDFIVM
ncbi:Ubiquitin-protein ligase, partial [Thalictrum thalictroides]